ncbi:MAG: hypothetical protein AAFZ04_08995 [Pseudomonadota bacterium]
MTSQTNASNTQKPRPVVALTCDADIWLCRAVVQALSEKAPGSVVRINPDPIPDAAFKLRVDATSEAGHLAWDTGTGDTVDRSGLDDASFATRLVEEAGPDLESALNQAMNSSL